jgi:hypothetical protein
MSKVKAIQKLLDELGKLIQSTSPDKKVYIKKSVTTFKGINPKSPLAKKLTKKTSSKKGK